MDNPSIISFYTAYRRFYYNIWTPNQTCTCLSKPMTEFNLILKYISSSENELSTQVIKIKLKYSSFRWKECPFVGDNACSEMASNTSSCVNGNPLLVIYSIIYFVNIYLFYWRDLRMGHCVIRQVLHHSRSVIIIRKQLYHSNKL